MKTLFNLAVLFLIASVLSSAVGVPEYSLAFTGGLFVLGMIAGNVESGVLQMAICPSACAPSLPTNYSGGCGIVTRPGGIKKFVMIKCDYEFTDITDLEEWAAAVTSGDVVASGLVLAQKPKGSFTKKRITSCEPEAVVGGEKTITFQDYNTDTVTEGGAGILHYDFWNTIISQTQNYRFGFITCDGYFYGPIDNLQIEIDEVIEDNDNGNTFFDGTISWNSVVMNAPVKVDLNGVL
jgi:hypothetical protein